MKRRWICSDPAHDERWGKPGWNTQLGWQETPLKKLNADWKLAPDGRSVMSDGHVCGACGEARGLGANKQAPLTTDIIGALAEVLGMPRDEAAKQLKAALKK
jgi:hypothetical protein